MKRLFGFIALVPLLFSAPLHAQETSGSAAGRYDVRLEVPIPAPPRTKTGHVVEAPEPNYSLNGTKCSSDVLTCGSLDFAGKARYFSGHSFGTGAFVGPLFWSALTLAKP